MGIFADGTWQKCIGMNRDGKCVSKRHYAHKKSWGSWYGRTDDPAKKKPGDYVAKHGFQPGQHPNQKRRKGK